MAVYVIERTGERILEVETVRALNSGNAAPPGTWIPGFLK